jgi:hypothetical protein
MKKIYLGFSLSIAQLVVLGQNKTLDFSTASGSYPNPIASETVVQNGDSWIVSVTTPNPQIYTVNYGDSHGNYLEVTGQGDASPGNSGISIKRTDGSVFDFSSIYLYAVGFRQQIVIVGLRSGVAVPGFSQTYDLGTFSVTGIPDATFGPSGWDAIDEIQIKNNGASTENGPGYENDVAVDIDDFVYAPASTLPVELTDFHAGLLRPGTVKVEWSTATEMNSDRFEVWRSADGNNFSLLSTVEGARTSSLSHTYEVLDLHPSKGVNYYRLVQYDQDGHRKVLGTKIVNVHSEKTAGIDIYPNPSASIVHIHFEAGAYQQVDLVDMNGRVIHSKKIADEDDQVNFDLTSLPDGVYLVKATGTQGLVFKRVIRK